MDAAERAMKYCVHKRLAQTAPTCSGRSLRVTCNMSLQSVGLAFRSISNENTSQPLPLNTLPTLPVSLNNSNNNILQKGRENCSPDIQRALPTFVKALLQQIPLPLSPLRLAWCLIMLARSRVYASFFKVERKLHCTVLVFILGGTIAFMR